MDNHYKAIVRIFWSPQNNTDFLNFIKGVKKFITIANFQTLDLQIYTKVEFACWVGNVPSPSQVAPHEVINKKFEMNT